MVRVHAYEFIIRWCHYCSISVLILYTYCLSVLYSVHQSFPVLLPVFHRIKVHSCSMYANRGERIRTFGHSLPKRVLYQTELHPVNNASVISCRITLTGPREFPSLSHAGWIPILFSLGVVSTDVFQSVCVYYSRSLVFQQVLNLLSCIL